MSNDFYGYLRVSTVEQNDARQRVAFEKYGIISKNIFGDKLSGKDFNCPQYQKLRKKLKEGDILVLILLSWICLSLTQGQIRI